MTAAGGMARPALRVRLHAGDPVRRRGLAAMLAASGHLVLDAAQDLSPEAAVVIAADAVPDVVLCDLGGGIAPPAEAEAPVVVLTDDPPPEHPAGVLPRAVEPAQLDAALRAVAAGLVVRMPGVAPRSGFHAADDAPPMTPREVEILTLVGQGLTNKAMARRLGISVHTVKFHLEALFAKLDATSRAEAVVKGLRGGAIEL